MTNKISISFDYSKLSSNYLGEFGEQLIKLYFIINGIDTYEPLIDDKGIDFIGRVGDGRYYEVQVKTIRLNGNSYRYITKENWKNTLRENLLVAYVVIENDLPPTLLLIPATAWQNDLADKILVDRNYEDKKSKPEWGINFNKNNIPKLIERYSIDKMLSEITNS